MNPSQFFLSPVNLGGLAILILLELWVTTVGGATGVFGLIPSGSMRTVLCVLPALIRIVPIIPVVDWKVLTTSPSSVTFFLCEWIWYIPFSNVLPRTHTKHFSPICLQMYRFSSWKACPSGVPMGGIMYGGCVVSVIGVVEVIGLDGPAGAMVLSVIIGT